MRPLLLTCILAVLILLAAILLSGPPVERAADETGLIGRVAVKDEGFVRVDADVPLAEMFGYATVLRSVTQGKAEFTMEFARYAPAPREVADHLVQQYQESRAAGTDRAKE